MTIILPQQPQQQNDAVHPLSAPISTTPLPNLTTLSTLWMPLDETIQAWATFGKEAVITSALMATSTAFGGLFWETKALRHYRWARDEQQHERWRKAAYWLGHAVQDLDCALDQWQQVLSWLDLAGNDDQQDPESLETIRILMGQAQEHQARRRDLHQQVQQEYASAKQQVQQHAHRNTHEEGTQR